MKSKVIKYGVPVEVEVKGYGGNDLIIIAKGYHHDKIKAIRAVLEEMFD